LLGLFLHQIPSRFFAHDFDQTVHRRPKLFIFELALSILSKSIKKRKGARTRTKTNKGFKAKKSQQFVVSL
jgi:hypothetical protein